MNRILTSVDAADPSLGIGFFSVLFSHAEIYNPCTREILLFFLLRNIPVTVSIIPGLLGVYAAQLLLPLLNKYGDLLTVAHHGWIHDNYEQRYNSEFGPSRSQQTMQQEILAGKEILDRYFGQSRDRTFILPYFSLTPAVLQFCREVGFPYVCYEHLLDADCTRMVPQADNTRIGASIRASKLVGEFGVPTQNQYATLDRYQTFEQLAPEELRAAQAISKAVFERIHRHNLANVDLGIPMQYASYHPKLLTVFNEWLSQMENAGVYPTKFQPTLLREKRQVVPIIENKGQ